MRMPAANGHKLGPGFANLLLDGWASNATEKQYLTAPRSPGRAERHQPHQMTNTDLRIGIRP
jgi:hypothetical protein